ncbi:MAG TPA: hypothetical protein VI757_16385 [Bacteroidia bacterium]|nr:hypothetical protein [Bacteroidia bacterium]
MAEAISYELVDLAVFENYVNPAVTDFNDLHEKVMWETSFTFWIEDTMSNKKGITTETFYMLYLTDDDNKEAIVKIKTYNFFTVTEIKDLRTKTEMVNLALDISLWNLQGTYAAIHEGSPLAKLIPPVQNMDQFQKSIRDQIKDEWK